MKHKHLNFIFYLSYETSIQIFNIKNEFSYEKIANHHKKVQTLTFSFFEKIIFEKIILSNS